ncbi:MAG: mandelate racemase/muconate lactonizing enzyme family protein [Candidatus Bathyarchaeota archaeon]|nr:mandelate racemase/muconate lactonizing enzyme family protein [Candidatus Bathyarchaeota archaeon]
MKIASVDAIVCRSSVEKPMWSLQPWRGGQYRLADFVECTFVKVASSDGLVGYGQTPGVRFHGPRVTSVGAHCRRLIEQVIAPEIVGEDSLDSSILWRRLHRTLLSETYSRSSLSAVDIALWDLKGKTLGLPIYRLLGGRYRKVIELYASKVPGIMNLDSDKEEEVLVDRLSKLSREGYSAFKLGAGLGLETDTRSVEIARDTVGEKSKIMLDAGCAYDLDKALTLGKRLQDLDVEWFEAPLPPSEIDGYVKLAEGLDVKIATDVHPEPVQVTNLLSMGGVDVVLTDVTTGGGMTASRKIVELTDLYNVECSTHQGWHATAIGYAASAHLSAVAPNLHFQEGRIHYGDNPFGNPILERPLTVERGILRVPEGSGLGVELKEEAIGRYEVS